MAGTISRKQRADRINFVLSRMRIGLSRGEIQRQFAQEYKTGKSQTKLWYQRAADSLIENNPEEQQRVRAVVLEFLYAQLMGCQQDLTTINGEIAKVDDWWEKQTILTQQLCDDNTTVAARKRLKLELLHKT
jgi:hypothetical protein